MKQSDIEKKYAGKRIGFKATDSNMSCRGYQYALNKLFIHDGPIKPYDKGFHLCKDFSSLYFYNYNKHGDKRFFIVEYGETYKDVVDMVITNEIRFLEEINPIDYIRDNDNNRWDMVSKFQRLTESEIIEFQDKVNWDSISLYQTLSEEFIREFKNYVDWPWVVMTNDLSYSFKREFKDYI